jgi:hypothetical protein
VAAANHIAALPLTNCTCPCALPLAGHRLGDRLRDEARGRAVVPGAAGAARGLQPERRRWVGSPVAARPSLAAVLSRKSGKGGQGGVHGKEGGGLPGCQRGPLCSSLAAMPPEMLSSGGL